MATTCPPSCPGSHHPIEGDGPEPCRLLFIGEGPARDEIRHHLVFAGRAGRELNLQYLPLAGLMRGGVRITNVMKCPCPGLRNPTVEEATVCANLWLAKELRYCQPEIIVTLGAVACHVLFPHCDLALEHGLPRWDSAAIGDWEGIHVALYHPAAGLHESSQMIPLQTDFSALRLIQLGRLLPPHKQDEYPHPVYREILDEAELPELLAPALHGDSPLAIDTEVRSLKTMEPCCLSFSCVQGTGYVIASTHSGCVGAFAGHVQASRRQILLHNALGVDLEALAQMNIRLDPRRIIDTMVRAYHLGDLPQGLKALAYRLCGMKMLEFNDLVRPYALSEALGYLQDAERLIKVDKTKRKVKRALGDFLKAPDSIDLWGRWDNWNDADREALVTAMGRELPRPSIVMVPWEKVVPYAARDADATLRVHPILEIRARELARRAG